MPTLVDLVQRTITRLSMVPGTSVQLYSEDRIAEMIQHKFVIVRSELWWDDMMTYATLTQGDDGRPLETVWREINPAMITDDVLINSYNDIQYAWSSRSPLPLKKLPTRSNPAGFMRRGTTMYRAPDAAKVIRFLPITPGQSMTVRYRQYYGTFMPADTVPMDDQLLILGAAYDYLEDDGTNPRQAEKFRNMFNDRLTQLRSEENDREIELTQRHGMLNGDWQTVA